MPALCERAWLHWRSVCLERISTELQSVARQLCPEPSARRLNSQHAASSAVIGSLRAWSGSNGTRGRRRIFRGLASNTSAARESRRENVGAPALDHEARAVAASERIAAVLVGEEPVTNVAIRVDDKYSKTERLNLVMPETESTRPAGRFSLTSGAAWHHRCGSPLNSTRADRFRG